MSVGLCGCPVELVKGREMLLREIDETIRLLEAELPANPISERNTMLADRLERELGKYFRALEDAMPWDAIEDIYYRLIKQD